MLPNKEQGTKEMYGCIWEYDVLVKEWLSNLFILDEKEKFEPTVFRDTLVQGLNEAGDDLEAVAKFLDSTGSRLDYRRYADTLFDILVAGSMLGKPHISVFLSYMCFPFCWSIFLWDRIFTRLHLW